MGMLLMRFIFLGYVWLWLLVTLLPSSYLLSYDNEPKHITIAKSYDGVIELQNNRGSIQDSVNRFVGNRLGSPYCQAFVSYVLYKSYGNQFKKTGLATAFRGSKTYKALDVVNGKIKVECGDVLTWQKGKTIYGHTGFSITDWKGLKGWTIQANTSPAGYSREGSGIHIKYAKIEIYNYSRIIKIHKIIPKQTE